MISVGATSEAFIKPGKILLVDDRKENLHALESLLQSGESQIFKAFSAREALELLLEHQFAVAILDVQMPDINGFELAELMRGSQATMETPIIFVTAGAIDPKQTFRGYEAGAVDLLYKPLDPRIVKSKVQIFLRLERQRVQIEQQMKQVQAALRVREEFLSIASHELKSPLTSLSLQLQLTRQSINLETGTAPSPEKLAKMIDMGNRQIWKLNRLIDDLLDISRIQAGKLGITKSEVDLPALVREVVDGFRTELAQAKCPVKLELQEPLHAFCEASRIDQVLTNLISNVIKYAPGTELTVSLGREGDWALLAVSDKGAGIQPEKLDSIFERFERLNDSSGVSGLGLGLYIVKQIMLAHGGDVHATSVPRQGTKFVAKFPISDQHKN